VQWLTPHGACLATRPLLLQLLLLLLQRLLLLLLLWVLLLRLRLLQLLQHSIQHQPGGHNFPHMMQWSAGITTVLLQRVHACRHEEPGKPGGVATAGEVPL
jgi:hypothetical protein